MDPIDTRAEAFDFEACFHANYSRIARAIARIVGDSGRAEELAVEAFWKLWRTPRRCLPPIVTAPQLTRSGTPLSGSRSTGPAPA